MPLNPAPSRLMVLLFTDIAGSVGLKTEVGAVSYGRLIAQHDRIFRDLVSNIPNAEVLKDTGDGFLARFANTESAVTAALMFQYRLASEAWGKHPIRVRVGIHLGEVSELGKDISGKPKLVGLAADVAARIMGLAMPGQILLTRAAFDEARQFVRVHPPLANGTVPDLSWIAHGRYLFQGTDEPMEVFEVGAAGWAPLSAPPDNEKVRSAVAAGEETMLGWRPAVGLEVPGRENWALERRLGEGGFGEVWLATHRKTHLHRVFKFCFDVERLRSFKRELTLFRLLREALGERPDIARLHDIQLDHPPYFLESEFTESGNLSDWAASVGGIDQVPLDQRIGLVIGTAEAVAAAHSIGILHKDIKPSNILIYEDAGAPRPRLADFGIGLLEENARLGERNITLSGFTESLDASQDPSRTGTRMYAPPELLMGQPFTARGDIYALGVVLYQLTIGDLNRPLSQGWERDVADPMLRQDIATCVAGRPEDRFESALELAANLRRLAERNRAHLRRKFTRVAAAVSLVLTAALTAASVWLVREHSLRSEAESRRVIAETEAAKSAATVMFLQDMLSAVDPNLGANRRDISVREVLDAAALQLEPVAAGTQPAASALGTQPEVEAAIRATIGSTYRALGLFDAAEPHLVRALDLRTRTLGERHLDTIASTTALAVLRREQGKLDEAEKLCSKSLELSKAVSGPEAQPTRHAMIDLAEIYSDQGRHKQAEELELQVLEICRRVVGVEHRDTLTAMADLSTTYRLQGRFAEAEPLALQVLEINTRLHGTDHVETLTAINNLATLYQNQGRLNDAEPLMVQALDVRRRTLGVDHPATLMSMNNLAAVRNGQGKVVEAESLYRQVVDLSTAKLGPDHPDTLLSLANLATTEGQLGKTDEAARLYADGYGRAKATLGVDHPLVRNFLVGLANADMALGKLQDAEPLFLTALDLYQRNDGPEHPHTLTTMSDLAGLYHTQRRYELAEPLYRQSLTIMQKTLGEDHSETLVLTNNLASIYRDMGRLDEADALMTKAVAGARRTLPAGHYYIALFLLTQGKLQTRMEQYDKAEASLLESEKGLAANFGTEHPQTQSAITALANLYDAWNKPDPAATWRQKLITKQPSTGS